METWNSVTTQTDLKNMANRRMARGLETTSTYPYTKKGGDLQQCSNYRTISLISHAIKVMLKIIMKRIERKLEAEMNVVQAGFRQGRVTRDHI